MSCERLSRVGHQRRAFGGVGVGQRGPPVAWRWSLGGHGGVTAVPGQQLVETSDRMVGDAGEHVGESSLGVDVVELGGGDQAVDDGVTLASTIGAGEQPRLAAERDATHRPLERRCW